jgi:hypothetical protein
MKRADLIQLARVGAERRITELQAEISALYKQFPDLRKGRVAKATEGVKRRTRRHVWSCASRSSGACPSRLRRSRSRGMVGADIAAPHVRHLVRRSPKTRPQPRQRAVTVFRECTTGPQHSWQGDSLWPCFSARATRSARRAKSNASGCVAIRGPFRGGATTLRYIGNLYAANEINR